MVRLAGGCNGRFSFCFLWFCLATVVSFYDVSVIYFDCLSFLMILVSSYYTCSILDDPFIGEGF